MTELLGKRMITSDGSMVGTIDDLLIDELSGVVEAVLVLSDGVANRYFPTDEIGRVLVPFGDIRSVQDVVVMDID